MRSIVGFAWSPGIAVDPIWLTSKIVGKNIDKLLCLREGDVYPRGIMRKKFDLGPHQISSECRVMGSGCGSTEPFLIRRTRFLALPGYRKSPAAICTQAAH